MYIQVTDLMAETGAAFLDLIAAAQLSVITKTMTQPEILTQLEGVPEFDLIKACITGEFPPVVGVYMVMERTRQLEASEPASPEVH